MMRRLFAVLATLGLLAGCSNEPVDTSINGIVFDAGRAVKAAVLPPPAPPRPIITRAQLAGIEVPVLMVEVLRERAQATAIPLGRNGNSVTWITANSVSLTFRDDVLFSTRGLGADLLSAETAPVTKALRDRRPARYGRSFRFIAGDESVRKESYFCELERDGSATREVLGIRHQTTQMRETCYAMEGAAQFRNIYWVGTDGVMWDSLQWGGPRAQYLQVQRILR